MLCNLPVTLSPYQRPGEPVRHERVAFEEINVGSRYDQIWIKGDGDWGSIVSDAGIVRQLGEVTPHTGVTAVQLII